MAREEADGPYEAKRLPNGTGLICPFDDCGGKLLVNRQTLKLLTGRRMNSRTCICPYCERRSQLPEEMH